MKKKLLLFASFALFALSSNAQSSIYFTQFVTTPTTPAAGTASWITDKGAFGTTASPYDSATYPNSFVTSGSAGFATLNFSTALALTASGASKGKIIVHWGSTSNRPLNLSINGAAVVKIDEVAVSADRGKVRTATYDLPDTTLDITSIKFVSSGGGAVSLFDVEIQTYGALGTGDFKADSTATVYANGSQVFVSNVKSDTTVAVYSLTGALVKTIETSSDTEFTLESGVWIAKVKSAEGEKSVKLLVK